MNKKMTILDVLVSTKLVKSRAEGKRLIKQGAVKVYKNETSIR